MKRLGLIVGVLMALATASMADDCVGGVCNNVLSAVPQFSYQGKVNAVVNSIADPHVVHQGVQNNVQHGQILLGDIAGINQQYNAMQAQLQAMGYVQQGFNGQQGYPQGFQQQANQYQNPYIPFAQAPYQAGTTAYGVRQVQIDAFGAPDHRQLMASIERYANRANDGANNLMGQFSGLAQQLAGSVDDNTKAALSIARIDAETRNNAAIAQAVTEGVARALQAGKASTQTSTTVQEYTPIAPNSVDLDFSYGTKASGGLLVKHCGSCHSGGVSKGEFSLGTAEPLELKQAMLMVMEGEMPVDAGGSPKPLQEDERLQLSLELMSLTSK